MSVLVDLFCHQEIHSNVVKDDLCTMHTWRLHPCQKNASQSHDVTLFARAFSCLKLPSWVESEPQLTMMGTTNLKTVLGGSKLPKTADF